MYAIIETGGKQFRVSQGDIVRVERLAGEEGSNVVFDRVLAVKTDKGEIKVGNPLVPGATAVGKILGEVKDKKIIVFKYKPKINYRKKQGHRQIKTRVVIEEIIAGS